MKIIKPLSRQRKYQLKKVKEGLCYLCGKKRNKYTYRCDKCQKKASVLNKEFYYARIVKAQKRLIQEIDEISDYLEEDAWSVLKNHLTIFKTK